jgi:hypothetical protein
MAPPLDDEKSLHKLPRDAGQRRAIHWHYRVINNTIV